MIGARRWAGIGAILATVVGCSAGPDPGSGGAMVAPEVGAARSALVASLDAWKAGRRDPRELIGSGPAVGVVDSTRRDRPLVGYEVVGPLLLSAGEVARPFAVRLVLGGPREEVSTRYVVAGRDPLWVFLREDYDRILHWEHKMTGEKK